MIPEQLNSIAALRAMDAGARGRLAAALEQMDFEEGQAVFAEGDPGDSMYFILQGRIHIEKRTASTGAENKTLAVLEEGDYFGEMALLDEKPRSASAVAAGRVRILRLSKAAFDQLGKSDSAAGMSLLFAMIRTAGERIRRLSAQLVVYDEVGRAIGEARDLKTLAGVILQQLAAATSADWGLLLLRAQFSDQLEVRAQANLALTPAQSAAISSGEGFLEPALRNPQELVIPDFAAHEPFAGCPRLGFETASLLVSPIRVEGTLLGLLVLGARATDHFDPNAANLARGVARQAAQAILNARHREEEAARSRHSRQFVRF